MTTISHWRVFLASQRSRCQIGSPDGEIYSNQILYYTHLIKICQRQEASQLQELIRPTKQNVFASLCCFLSTCYSHFVQLTLVELLYSPQGCIWFVTCHQIQMHRRDRKDQLMYNLILSEH